MKLFRHDLHSLTGAYALDALEEGAESERFARHLDRCSSCASEVRGFREVATELAFAATGHATTRTARSGAGGGRPHPPASAPRSAATRGRGRASARMPRMPVGALALRGRRDGRRS